MPVRRTRKTRAVIKRRTIGRRRPTMRRKRGGSLFSWIKNKAVPWISREAKTVSKDFKKADKTLINKCNISIKENASLVLDKFQDLNLNFNISNDCINHA